VGKGAIILAPFLDVNCNGIRDKGEKKVDGLNIHVAGGRMQRLKDSSIAILGLEAYTNCFIELDKNGFENIAWQLNKKTLSVAVNANMFKKIDIPIMVMGEVAGTVYLDNQKGKNGLSRVIVNLFAEDGRQVGRALTEADGYFTYLGLAPGRYYATVDSEQMKKLNLSTKRLHQSFTIKQTQEGDFVEGIDFVLGEEKGSL
jgi:hypothetical protein